MSNETIDYLLDVMTAHQMTYDPAGTGAPLVGFPFEDDEQMTRAVVERLRAELSQARAEQARLREGDGRVSDNQFKMVRRTPETAQADVDAAYRAGYAQARADAAAVCRARAKLDVEDMPYMDICREMEANACAEAIERLAAPAGVDSGPQK